MPPRNTKTMMPPRNLQQLPPDTGEGAFVDPRVFVVWSSNYFKQNGYNKILIGCIWEKGLWGRWLVAIWLHLALNKGTRIQIYFRMSPLQSFCDHLFNKILYTPGFWRDALSLLFLFVWCYVGCLFVGCSIPIVFLFLWSLVYFEQSGYITNFIGRISGKEDWGGGASSHRIIFDS